MKLLSPLKIAGIYFNYLRAVLLWRNKIFIELYSLQNHKKSAGKVSNAYSKSDMNLFQTESKNSLITEEITASINELPGFWANFQPMSAFPAALKASVVLSWPHHSLPVIMGRSKKLV